MNSSAVNCVILATLLVGLVLPICESARILAFFPIPAKSHQAFFRPIIKELSKRGHEVVAYLPQSISGLPKTYKEVILPDMFAGFQKNMDLTKLNKMWSLSQRLFMFEMSIHVQTKMLELQEIQDLIHSEDQFDLILMETHFIQESYAALQHKFGAPIVELFPAGSFYWLNENLGNPHNPSYVADMQSPYTDRMNFFERLVNTFQCYSTFLLTYLYYLPRIENVASQYINYKGWEGRPYLKELLSNESLVLTNSHYSLNYANPMGPNFIEVAGVHLGPNKPLPKDLQKFMDEAKDGVIYFSMGSNLNVSDVVKDNLFTAFKNAFSKLKQKVLWKWEKDDFPGKPENVFTSKWFPQVDILAHKNVKLFITHGGFLSLTEAVNYGVPLIGIPIFADQPRNMKQVTSTGYGLKLDLDDITEEKITQLITEILNNPKYEENAKMRMEMFRDRPMKPLDVAMYWIEYVIKYKGANHLKSPAAFMPWCQTALLDVWAAVISFIALNGLFFYLIVSMIRKMICGPKTSQKHVKIGKKKTN